MLQIKSIYNIWGILWHENTHDFISNIDGAGIFKAIMGSGYTGKAQRNVLYTVYIIKSWRETDEMSTFEVIKRDVMVVVTVQKRQVTQGECERGKKEQCEHCGFKHLYQFNTKQVACVFFYFTFTLDVNVHNASIAQFQFIISGHMSIYNCMQAKIGIC